MKTAAETNIQILEEVGIIAPPPRKAKPIPSKRFSDVGEGEHNCDKCNRRMHFYEWNKGKGLCQICIEWKTRKTKPPHAVK